MKIKEIVSETTTSGSIASIATPMGGMQKRNPDGTAKNALDMKNNLMGTKKSTKKSKKE